MMNWEVQTMLVVCYVKDDMKTRGWMLLDKRIFTEFVGSGIRVYLGKTLYFFC